MCLVFKVTPQSPELDGLFLNHMESLCLVLAVMTELAICSEMLWVCAQDCLAELTPSVGPIFSSQHLQLSPPHALPHLSPGQTSEHDSLLCLHPRLKRLPVLALVWHD